MVYKLWDALNLRYMGHAKVIYECLAHHSSFKNEIFLGLVLRVRVLSGTLRLIVVVIILLP